ncbi:uncharacterized protein C8R40DRAFT_77940 [Lentinula edodes]|uniref:uncharacterized protein n=1 Tax=Lentinula edodes TaxID=5353 RepID=UPI001E8E996F|nr:uncharacterized protein C8R40DRAFT_77940 [Lentinula edodes]KAH7876877.1 hypothetical protein C8R40DRAFT_77940 [Lentinula edodes]
MPPKGDNKTKPVVLHSNHSSTMDEFGKDIDPLNICDGFDQDSPIFSYADVDELRETRGSLNSYKKECYSGLGRIHTEIGALKTENRELEERLRDGKMHLRYLQRKKHSMTDNPKHPTKRRRSNTNKDTVLKNLTASCHPSERCLILLDVQWLTLRLQL